MAHSPSHRPRQLERELQPDLNHAATSRTDQRIARCHVGCGAPAAERAGARGVVAEKSAIRCAVWIGDDGMIEQVKELGPELGSVSLPVREGLEYREIHVLEARVAEDVPAHRAKGSEHGRNHDRSAGHEAAARPKRARVRGDGGASRPQVCGCRGGTHACYASAKGSTGDAAGLRAAASARAEHNGVRAGLEVPGVPEEIPAIAEILAAHAEIVALVVHEPRQAALNAHYGV